MSRNSTEWIDMVFADLGLIEPKDFIDPAFELDDENEVVIGELPEELRRLYTLLMWAKRDFSKSLDVLTESSGEINASQLARGRRAEDYVEALGAVFEASLFHAFEAWEEKGIGVIRGYRVIAPKRIGASQSVRAPKDVANWLTVVLKEMNEMDAGKMLAPLPGEVKGEMVGNLSKNEGIHRLHTLVLRAKAKGMRAQADYIDSCIEDREKMKRGIIEWGWKERVLEDIFRGSVCYEIPGVWSAANTKFVVKENWDILRYIPDEDDEEENGEE